MKILIVSATQNELSGLSKVKMLEGKPAEIDLKVNHKVDLLVSGVGAVSSAFYMAKIADSYDLIINIGIAGSFRESIPIGSVVILGTDAFGDYGVDDNGIFIPLTQLGLTDSVQYQNPWLKRGYNPTKLTVVNGVTLAMASGSADSINRTMNAWNPDVETMECAAIFFVCLRLSKPFVCIRAISNMVEPRNKNNWNIGLALDNLKVEVLNYLKEIDV